MDGRGVEVTHKSAWVANTRGSYPNRYDEGGGRGVLSSPSPNSQILEKNEKKIFWKKKIGKKIGFGKRGWKWRSVKDFTGFGVCVFLDSSSSFFSVVTILEMECYFFVYPLAEWKTICNFASEIRLARMERGRGSVSDMHRGMHEYPGWPRAASQR